MTRSYVTARQRTAARLILDGWSAYRAMRQAGYSHWSARVFGHLLRNSWGLRQAILEEEQARNHRLTPPPKPKKHDRRKLSLAVRSYVFDDNAENLTNVPLKNIHDQELLCHDIAAGVPPRQIHPGPRFEENAIRCPSCNRLLSKKKLFLTYNGMGYVCGRCAGI